MRACGARRAAYRCPAQNVPAHEPWPKGGRGRTCSCEACCCLACSSSRSSPSALSMAWRTRSSTLARTCERPHPTARTRTHTRDVRVRLCVCACLACLRAADKSDTPRPPGCKNRCTSQRTCAVRRPNSSNHGPHKRAAGARCSRNTHLPTHAHVRVARSHLVEPGPPLLLSRQPELVALALGQRQVSLGLFEVHDKHQVVRSQLGHRLHQRTHSGRCHGGAREGALALWARHLPWPWLGGRSWATATPRQTGLP